MEEEVVKKTTGDNGVCEDSPADCGSDSEAEAEGLTSPDVNDGDDSQIEQRYTIGSLTVVLCYSWALSSHQQLSTALSESVCRERPACEGDGGPSYGTPGQGTTAVCVC